MFNTAVNAWFNVFIYKLIEVDIKV